MPHQSCRTTAHICEDAKRPSIQIRQTVYLLASRHALSDNCLWSSVANIPRYRLCLRTHADAGSGSVRARRRTTPTTPLALMSADLETLQRACRLRWPKRHIAGLAGALGRPRSTAAAWLAGRRRIPAGALERLARVLARDAEVIQSFGQQIAFAAKQEAKRPRLPRGWQVVKVRDASGIPRDGRWHGGRAKSRMPHQ